MVGFIQRLKRVFAIEIEKCEKCGGSVRIIASIEDPDVIQKILKHLALDRLVDPQNRSPLTQPTNKRRYCEVRRIDYASVTVSIGQGYSGATAKRNLSASF